MTFLQRGKAKLAIAEVLGILDRWIRRTLYESEQERWKADWDLYYRAKQLAKEEKPGRSLSLGTMQRIWLNHPMQKYLTEVQVRLDIEKEATEPPGPYDNLSNEEFDDYIKWRRNASPDIDKLSVEEKLATWRREGRRVLPVLPKSGSLPTNRHVGRPDHKERGGRPSEVPAPETAQEAREADGRDEGIGAIPVGTSEVH